VVGTTARQHGTRLPPSTPREIAPHILARAQHGRVALLFGPEDTGLNNSELDRCHQLITIPTESSYTSLNLAQAVLVVLYELRQAAVPAEPASQQLPADAAQLEQFFSALEQALSDVQFFKTEHAKGILSSLRSLTYRANPNTHEAALLLAIAREISHFGRRMANDK
jgi:TrmH family RNA methyltransferase